VAAFSRLRWACGSVEPVTSKERTAHRFEGQVAIVTGAARGLGLATSKLLGSEGATVVMVDVNSKLLAQSGALLNEHGLAAEVVSRDTTDKEAVADLVDQTIDRYGRIDVLVNVAGPPLRTTIEKTTLDDWQRVIQSTLDSSFLTARHSTAAHAPRAVREDC